MTGSEFAEVWRKDWEAAQKDHRWEEIVLVASALAHAEGKVSKAAEIMGVNRYWVYRTCKRLGIRHYGRTWKAPTREEVLSGK